MPCRLTRRRFTHDTDLLHSSNNPPPSTTFMPKQSLPFEHDRQLGLEMREIAKKLLSKTEPHIRSTIKRGVSKRTSTPRSKRICSKLAGLMFSLVSDGNLLPASGMTRAVPTHDYACTLCTKTTSTRRAAKCLIRHLTYWHTSWRMWIPHKRKGLHSPVSPPQSKNTQKNATSTTSTHLFRSQCTRFVMHHRRDTHRPHIITHHATPQQHAKLFIHLGNAVQHDMSHVLPPHVQHRLGRQLAVRAGHAGAAGPKKREPNGSHAGFALDSRGAEGARRWGHTGGGRGGGSKGCCLSVAV